MVPGIRLIRPPWIAGHKGSHSGGDFSVYIHDVAVHEVEDEPESIIPPRTVPVVVVPALQLADVLPSGFYLRQRREQHGVRLWGQRLEPPPRLAPRRAVDRPRGFVGALAGAGRREYRSHQFPLPSSFPTYVPFDALWGMGAGEGRPGSSGPPGGAAPASGRARTALEGGRDVPPPDDGPARLVAILPPLSIRP
jgi:hypothetical protein